MDPDKVALLFPDLPESADPDDKEERASLLSDALGLDDDAPAEEIFRLMVEEAIASQIADDEPPEVWATAQRLSSLGLDRTEVLRNLRMTLLPVMESALVDGKKFDRDRYVAALARLPMPDGVAIEEAMVSVVRARRALAMDEMEKLVAEQLGFDVEEEPWQTLIDRVTDRVIDDDGPLALMAPDVVVEPASLTAGIVLTHRVHEFEHSVGSIPAGVDLAGFTRCPVPLHTSEGDEVWPFSAAPADLHRAWKVRDGWLDRYAPGTLLAVQIDGDVVSFEVVDDEPVMEPDLVSALRAVYDREVDEPGLPVSAEDLVYGMLVDDPKVFSVPRLPLGEIIEAAGLELNGGWTAHEQAVWDHHETARRRHRVIDRLDEFDIVKEALSVLEAFDTGADDPDTLKAVLKKLRDPELVACVADEMLGFVDAEGMAEDTLAFAHRLVDVARPTESGPAHWLAAVAFERLGEVSRAEEELELAVRTDPVFLPAIDRLAWYRSDRGNAVEAVRLWRRLGVGLEDNIDLRIVESYARPKVVKLGRNEQCWCGSGRKFKVCHIDRAEAASLEDRITWFLRKPVAYLERRGGHVIGDVHRLAAIRAEESGSDIDDYVNDPLNLDILLNEGGWFRRFLSDRGPLLPDDEAILGTAWAFVERTVYEIAESRPGEGLTLKDLRTGDSVDVKERTFSRDGKPGQLICARVVPVGESYQLVGAPIRVRPGRETELVQILDVGDADELVEFVARDERPLSMVTRESEPLIECRRVFAIDDPGAARSVLDELYEARDEGVWVEMHELAPDDSILRASLYLDDGRITVETHSVKRLERVTAALVAELPTLKIVSTSKRPLMPGQAPRPPRHIAASAPDSEMLDPSNLDPSALEEFREQILDRFERRWCDEPVPALAGLTPRQAAADPTRRENLERLLADFTRMDEGIPEDRLSFTMRPDRLRELLRLDR